jgi:hypothetical protein
MCQGVETGYPEFFFFSHFLQADAEIVSWIKPEQLLSTNFLIHYHNHPIIWRYKILAIDVIK